MGRDEWADNSQWFLCYAVVRVLDLIKLHIFDFFDGLRTNLVECSHPEFIVWEIKWKRAKWKPEDFNGPIVQYDFSQFLFWVKYTGHARIEVARFYDYFMIHLNGKIQISWLKEARSDLPFTFKYAIFVLNYYLVKTFCKYLSFQSLTFPFFLLYITLHLKELNMALNDHDHSDFLNSDTIDVQVHTLTYLF